MTYFLVFLGGVVIGSIGGLLLSAILTVGSNHERLKEAYDGGYKDGYNDGRQSI